MRAASAAATFGTCFMGGDRPYFVTTPDGRLVTKKGGGFVHFATEDEAKSFAQRLTDGWMKIDSDGRVPAGALG